SAPSVSSPAPRFSGSPTLRLPQRAGVASSKIKDCSRCMVHRYDVASWCISRALSPAQPFQKCGVAIQAAGKELIAVPQRMMRVLVEHAGQHFRHNVSHVIPVEPIPNAVAETAERDTVVSGHDVFVERAKHHKDVIVARTQQLYQSLKRG